MGFVNEGSPYSDDAPFVPHPTQVALLRQWLAAGFELADRTFSHSDLNRVPLEQYHTDVARGDSVIGVLMGGRGRRPRFFRHPYLHTGRDAAARARVDSALAARGSGWRR